MMRHLTVACLLYTALVLQPMLGHTPILPGFRPWLPGVVLVASVVLTDGIASLVWAGLLGLAVDSLSVDRLGVHIAISTVVAASLMTIRGDGRSHGAAIIGSFILFGTFCWRSFAAIVHGLIDRQPFDVPVVAASALAEGVSTAVPVALILLIGHLMTSVFRQRQQSSLILVNRWSMLVES